VTPQPGPAADAEEEEPPAAPRRGPWSLRRRVTTLLATVSAILVGAVFTITLSALQARDSMLVQVDELGPSQVAIQQMMSAQSHLETSLRGYIETTAPEFLESYREVQTTQEESLETLTALAVGDEELSESLAAVADAAQAWNADYAEPAIETIQDGGEVSALDMRQGRELYNDLRSASVQARDEIAAATESAQLSLTTATQQLIALLVLIGVVIVALLIFVWVLLQDWVLRPLDELGRHLQQVAEGSYQHRIELRAPPEIERVGREVEAMRGHIVSDLDEVAEARRTLQHQSELLERQAEELRRSNEELEQFAYVASHDLQEPLRKVASFCQLLQRRYRGRLDDRADAYIDYAVEGAKRMQTLINGLLAFSRVGRTRDFAPVVLDDAYEAAVRSLASALEDADAQVSADELPTVWGDKTLLTQVLFNLISNAIKFRTEEPPRVRIGVEEADEEWVFSCTDNGIGIEGQYAERIFVLFSRLHPRERYGGTGIGLAMCRKIVEFHGGRMWLDPDYEEQGTRIRWSLPKRPPQDEAAQGSMTGAEDTRGHEGTPTQRPGMGRP
jgi:signal transduction histidine kinase